MPSASGATVSSESKPALVLGLRADGLERRLEAAPLEDHRVQRGHRVAHAVDRVAHDLVGARHLSAPGRRLDQVLMGGQQALEGLVVKRLGDTGPLALLGPQDLGDQRRPLAAQLLDLAASSVASTSAAEDAASSSSCPSGPEHSDHSSRPRRIASATAAARSETPSFS